ncbi:MAG: hypothetical protein GXY83_32730 [Rhodopirellula sp.]|nr:hypothetical protein [Rhodopirellula sp.]
MRELRVQLLLLPAVLGLALLNQAAVAAEIRKDTYIYKTVETLPIKAGASPSPVLAMHIVRRLAESVEGEATTSVAESLGMSEGAGRRRPRRGS